MMQGANLNQSNSFPYDEGMANSSYQFTRGTNFSDSIFNRTSRGPRIDPSAPTEESTSLTLYCVVLIGFAGSLANGVVLFAFLDKNLRKQTKNVLLITQVSFDFLSCVLMTISYIVKIPIANDSRNQLVVTWGRAVCILFVGDGLFYVVANCTAANLAMIALERYFKIVHPIGHRNHFRRWMLYVVIGFDLVYGFLVNIMIYWTTDIDRKYGKCNSYTNWPNPTSERVNASTQLFINYFVVLSVFFYCYGRIFHAMRKKKTNVAPIHVRVTSQMTSNDSSHGQKDKSKNGQANVIKTMILVSTVYGVTTAPALFGSAILAYDKQNFFFNQGWVYYAEVGLLIVNILFDPYIYAFSLDGLRKKLSNMFCAWRKISKLANLSSIL